MKHDLMAKSKNIFKLSISQRYNVLLIVCTCLILFVRLFHITELNGLYLFNDEMGYWSHAANLLGMEWLGTEVGYYSYGYSFLLVPILFLTKNMALAYKLAIFENAILGVLSFFVGIRIIEKIDSECYDFIKLSISFCAANYSAFLYQSNIAWSETFLYFIFLVTVWSALNFFENQSLKNTILFSLCIGALYVVHNRTLAIVIAFGITLLIMFIKRRIPLWKLGIMLGIILVLYFCNGIMKNYMLRLMWGDNETSWSRNIASNYFSRVNFFTSLDGIGALLKSLAGKIWYLLISTIMLAYFGFIYIVKKIVFAFKNKSIANFYFLSFVLLCILGMIATDTIAMVQTSFDYSKLYRLDTFFYGRYEDVVSGILIMCGLLYFKENKALVKRDFGVGIAIFVICSASLYYRIKEIPEYFLNTNNVPGIYFFKTFGLMNCCVAVSVIAIEVYSVLTLIQKKRTVIMVIASTLLVAVFMYVGENAYEEGIKPTHELYDSLDDIYQLLNSHNEYNIYLRGSNEQAGQSIRARVTQGHIIFTSEQNDLDNDSFYVISTEELLSILDDPDAYFVADVLEDALIVYGQQLAKNLQGEGYSPISLADITPFDAVESELHFADVVYNENEQKINANINITMGDANTNGYLYNVSRYQLAYHIYDLGGNIILWDGERMEIDSCIAGDQLYTLEIPAGTLPENYMIEIDLVEEGISWFSEEGGKTDTMVVLSHNIEINNSWLSYYILNNNIEKQGFDNPEGNGFAWTISEEAEIVCDLSNDANYAAVMRQGNVIPLNELGLKQYEIEVYLNDKYLDTLIINSENNGSDLLFYVPAKVLSSGSNVFTFKSNLWSPTDYGADDARKLGFALFRLQFADMSKQLDYNVNGVFVGTGFDQVENDFVWTNSERAEIFCILSNEMGDYRATLTQGPAIPFEQLGIDEYNIEVYLNGTHLDTLTIDSDNNGGTLQFTVPASEIMEGENTFSFESNLWSPADYGSADTRQLGFSFSGLSFENVR